jgi:hypothetical protein
MGGDRWLQFKSLKERVRAEHFLDVGQDTITIEVVSPFNGKPVTCGCYLDTKAAKTLAVSYSANWLNRFVADLVSREIARRFDVRRIGADSVGWYSDTDWQAEGPRTAKADYGPYTSWVAWMKDYRIEWDRAVGAEDRPLFDLIETEVVALFKQLDEKQQGASK